MDNILEVTGLVKRYPSFTLDNISFSLPEGCVTGFIGANGAGKTTTIRSILGLAHKDAGVVKIFGLDADDDANESLHYGAVYFSLCATFAFHLYSSLPFFKKKLRTAFISIINRKRTSAIEKSA